MGMMFRNVCYFLFFSFLKVGCAFGSLPFFLTIEEGYCRFTHTPFFTYGQILPLVGPNLDVPFWTAEEDHFSGLFTKATGGAYFPWPSYVCLAPWRVSISYEHFFDEIEKSYSEVFSGGTTLEFPNVDGQSAIDADGQVSGTFGRNLQLDRVEIDLSEAFSFVFAGFPLKLEPFLAYEWSRFEQEYVIHHSYDDDDIVTQLKERLKTHYHDVGGGLALRVFLPYCFSFLIEGKALASRGHAHFKGTSFIINASIPPTTVTSAELSLDDSRWSGKYTTKGGIFYHIRDFTLGITGTYEFWNFVPEISNLQLDIENTALLQETHVSFFTIRALVSLFF